MKKNFAILATLTIFFGMTIFLSQEKLSFRDIFIKPPPKQPKPAQIETLELPDVIQMFHNDLNLFVDTRIKKYFDYAHIPRSINIPAHEIKDISKETLVKLKQAPNVIVLCTSNSCGISYRATRELMNMGLDNVKVYPAGWAEWKACKLMIND